MKNPFKKEKPSINYFKKENMTKRNTFKSQNNEPKRAKESLVGSSWGVRINETTVERQIYHSISYIKSGRIIEIWLIGKHHHLINIGRSNSDLIGYECNVGICKISQGVDDAPIFGDTIEQINCKIFNIKTEYPDNNPIVTKIKLKEVL